MLLSSLFEGNIYEFDVHREETTNNAGSDLD